MDIRPDHYHDAQNGCKVPVFKPTMEQFRDFNAFVKAVDEYGKRAGIVKVVPPKAWRDSLPDLTDKLKGKMITSPIEQHFQGSAGIYKAENIELPKKYSLEQWQRLCMAPEHRPPATRNFPIGPNSVPITDTVRRRTGGNSSRTGPMDFRYRTEETGEYSDEYCKEIEKVYWKSLIYSATMYGADIQGTLFDGRTTEWNVDRLENLLNRLTVPIPGVNKAYLYFGMWKSTFAWHVEDIDLYSINYIHFGAPKQWYVIPPEYGKKFESVMQSYFSLEYHQCRDFLRHKAFHVSPTVLRTKDVPVHTLIQREGEFVITFPYGYHAGYNLDYNCAESVNFALESWIPIGKKASVCRCVNYSVKIDVASIFNDFLNDEGDEQEACVPEHAVPSLLEPRTKKPRPKVEKKPRKASNTQVTLLRGNNPTSIKIVTKRAHADEAEDDHEGRHSRLPAQCILCPVQGGSLCRTDVEGQFAHGLCASFIPETFIATIGEATDYVIGIQTIPKARWQLVCEVCKTNVGACIQCVEFNCKKAFHASCAQRVGYHLQQRITTYGEFIYEGYCKIHDPRLFAEKRAKNAGLSEKATVGMTVWVKSQGGWCEGVISDTHDDRLACSVRFSDGSVQTCSLTYLRFSDPEPV